MTNEDLRKAISEAGRAHMKTINYLAEVASAGVCGEPAAAKRYVMKQEAHERLQILKIYAKTIWEFMERDVLNRSETRYGFLYWLNEEEKRYVREFEKKTGFLVYHVVKSELRDMGTCYSMFYVSDEVGEWCRDRKDLQDGEPFVYVYTADEPTYSEYGYIGIVKRNGGVARVA